MHYKSAKIYFSSGTGNSYRVAAWLHEACTDRNTASEIVPIDRAKPREEIEATSDSLVAVVFPTHGLLPPWSMIKFIFGLPFKRGTGFFCAPTRGSFYLGPVLIPGIAGLASILPVIVALFKGYNVRGSVSFDMPVNITSVHGRLGDNNIKRILTGAKQKADKYFDRLLSGKSVWFTLNNLWEYFWSIILMIYWPLWPVAYLLLGRFFMGKILFANNSCIGCGTCANSCPNNAIAMTGKAESHPYWRYNCEHCLRCMNYCPQKAIEAGHSWAVALYYIGGFPLATYIFKYAEDFFPNIIAVKNYWTWEIVNCLYYYPAYLIAYYVFFNLIRLKPVNTLFTYTTFTRIFHRYHEPGTSLKNLLNKKK